MEPLRIQEICDATNGKLLFGKMDEMITGINTDTRTIQKGDFFVPIKGEFFDGQNFIEIAREKGACGSFIETGKSKKTGKNDSFHVIEVKDSKYAMGELARYYRSRFNLPVIAITGSNGKTSTKEMIASILNIKYKVLKSEGSFNNDIGLPLTLFKLEKSHQVAVLEMGMNNYGEIRRMVSIIPPDIGVVTNVTEAHIEYFGSLENIANAKFELLESMSEKNIAVLNADDKNVRKYDKKTKAKPVFFGIKSHEAQFRGKDIRFVSEPYGLEFTLITPQGEETVYLPVLGEHQVANAIAAAATAWQLNPDMDSIREGLKKFKTAKMRMQVIKINQFIVINDAYNANPISMKAALDTLQNLTCKGKKYAVLADMLELGDLSKKAHQQIGHIVAMTGLAGLFLIGEKSKEFAQGALSKGMNKSDIYFCESKSDCVNQLGKKVASDDLVLVKGSRKMKLEELVEELQKRFNSSE